MQIKFIMTLDVEGVSPRMSLQEAALKMKSLDVGMLPVCGDDNRLVGVLTDRDIVVRSTAEGLDPKASRVGDLMSLEVQYCFEDQDVQEAAKLMEEHQI